MTWKQLCGHFRGEIQGAVYTHHYLDPAVAHRKEEETCEAGDFDGEMGWSAKPLAAIPLLDRHLTMICSVSKPETVKETLQRVYGKQ